MTGSHQPVRTERGQATHDCTVISVTKHLVWYSVGIENEFRTCFERGSR
jgi:hypothetical protein